MDMSKLPRMGGASQEEGTRAAALPVRATPQHEATFCKQCGLPVDQFSRFCGNCGAALNAPLPAPQPPLPPAVESVPADRENQFGEDVRSEILSRYVGVWVLLIFSAILIMLGSNYASYLFSQTRGQIYHTGVNWTTGNLTGQEVAYEQLENHSLWTDSSFFIGGCALLVASIANLLVAMMGRRSPGIMRAVALFGAAFALIATVFNIYRCSQLFGAHLLPLFQLLIVAVGGYLVFDQITLTRLCYHPESRPVPRV